MVACRSSKSAARGRRLPLAAHGRRRSPPLVVVVRRSCRSCVDATTHFFEICVAP
jgi:hypothetical protein